MYIYVHQIWRLIMAQSSPNEKEMVTFRINKATKEKLVSLADVTGRSQTFLVEEALEAFCDLHAWQVTAIQEGILAVDEGRITSHEEVKRYWEQKLEDSMG